jgi:hypothetical protein
MDMTCTTIETHLNCVMNEDEHLETLYFDFNRVYTCAVYYVIILRSIVVVSVIFLLAFLDPVCGDGGSVHTSIYS